MLIGKNWLQLVLLVLLSFCATQCANSEEYLYWRTPPRDELLRDGKLHIFMVGTGNPESEMQSIRKPSCVAVLVQGQFVLIDAGEGAIQNIAAFGLPYHEIDKLFITHWHSDHFAGMGQVINASWIHGRKKPFTVYGPFGVKKIVDAINSAYELDAIYRSATVNGAWDPGLSAATPIEVPSSDEEVTVYQKDGLKISAFRVDHTPVVPSIGYVVEWAHTRVVFSGDTRICDELEKHAKGADILVNEAFSRPLAEQVRKASNQAGDVSSVKFVAEISRYHSDSDELAAMAQRAGVKRLVITHYVPAIPTDPKIVDSFVAGMKTRYSGILWPANDGDEIVVSKTDGSVDQIEYHKYPQLVVPASSVFPSNSEKH
jgi:ribonuclease Z